MWLYGAKTRGEGTSEMPGAPIKVETVGFTNVNPTSRSRRVGGEKQRRNNLLWMVLVGNSVLEEGQPVSEQRGLFVDWKEMPTAGGRMRKRKWETSDPERFNRWDESEMKRKGDESEVFATEEERKRHRWL